MIAFEKFELENGLKVIFHEDKTTPLVCINILYDVGARDEDESKTGFAHLFEHLMFGGSVNVPNYDTPLQLAGGENNAFTNNDITNYYLTIPADNLETGFWLESDRMLSLAFTPQSLEVQRSVVIEEFKQRYLNQPYGDVWLLLKPLAYKVHPYKWNTIGKEIKHIEDATMDDVKSFFKNHYGPNNAIMVVAGNTTLEKAKELTNKWFAPLDKIKVPVRNLPQEPKQTSERIEMVYRDVPASAIYKAYHICSKTDPEYYTFDLLSDLLSNGRSARLYNSLVKQQKLFSEINAYVTGDFDKGLFIVSGKLTDGTTPAIANEAIEKELANISKEIVSPDELQKVKNKVESTLVFSEMNVLNKAMNLAFSELLGDANNINLEAKKYNAVTSEGIMKVAQETFRKENCSTLYYLTKNEE